MVQRHIREPYLVEKCKFSIPGDTTSWEPKDDDNDGQYTGMYLVMESYRYAVTNDPEARENAAKAFHALKFLQTVTRTKGFVARTVIPATWNRMADPNVIISDREWVDRIIREPWEKKVEDQWLLSGDGKWLWKRGTSSDEITGHMYGYLFYYNLVANPEEKKDVEKHIVRIVDYIIENDYVLADNKLNLERSIWLLQDNPLDLMRWDNNPWAAVQGDGGYTESDGVYWLLAYWMGRYYGLIE